MAFENLLANKKAFILGLDNVLYPEKDYLLQVYYLFSEFMAYTVQLDAKEIIGFMQTAFASDGSEQIFEQTAKKFNIPLTYRKNFQLLHQNAQLPLKLLLYQQILAFLQEIVIERKEIFLLIDGDPVEQLNKLRQFEWHGLEKYLKVYFSAEFAAKPSPESIIFIQNQYHLQPNDILLIGHTKADENYAEHVGIDYVTVEKLL